MRFLAVAILLPLTLAACGGKRVDAPEHATLTGEQASTVESDGWTLGVAPGRSVGEVAYPTPVLLRDGTTSTIAEIANGSPLLLYFFATW